MKVLILAFALGSLMSHAALAADDQDIEFELSSLETGRMVTLPRPATTYMDLDQEVKLSATDMPQNLVITVVAPQGHKVSPVTVTIYDSFSDRSKALTIAPGTPALYPFKALSSIRLVPKRLMASGTRLKIESNKPLGIGR